MNLSLFSNIHLVSIAIAGGFFVHIANSPFKLALKSTKLLNKFHNTNCWLSH